MSWVSDERQALAATLRDADPQAATLCAGWDVRRLLAHLIVREHQPITAIADALAHKPAGAEPRLSKLVASASTPPAYQALVTRFAAGPARWSPRRWVDQQFNLLEYIIHHEDIRRAGPDAAPPRRIPAEEQDTLWKSLRLIARLSLRRSPVPVTLAAATGAVHMAKRGDTAVKLTGDPVELALYLSGRRDHAHVQLTGPDDSVNRFVNWTAAS